MKVSAGLYKCTYCVFKLCKFCKAGLILKEGLHNNTLLSSYFVSDITVQPIHESLLMLHTFLETKFKKKINDDTDFFKQ